MADLLPPLNYAGQLADAAASYGQANHLNQQAEQQRLQNNIKKMVMPLIAKGISGVSAGNQDAPAQYPINFQQTPDPSGQGDGQTGQQGTVTQPAAQPGTQIQPQPGAEGVGADGIPDLLRKPSPDTASTTPTDTTPTNAGGGTLSTRSTVIPAPPKTIQEKIADHADSVAAQTLMPSPTEMDAPHRTLYMGLMLAGERDGAEGVKAAWDAKVGRENQQKVVMANRALGIANDVEDMPAKLVPLYLQRNAPDIAARVPKGMNPELLKQSLLNAGGSSFRYTGIPMKINDEGYAVNGLTGQKIPTLDYQVGLSQAQKADVYKAGTQVIDSFRGNRPAKMPIYESQGYKNATEWGDSIIQAAARSGKSVQQIMRDQGVPEDQIPQNPYSPPAKQGSIAPTPKAPGSGNSPSKGNGKVVPSYNSPTGAIDFSTFSKKPPFGAPAGTINLGPTGDERTYGESYPKEEDAALNEAKQSVAYDNDGVNRDQRVLARLDTMITPGRASGGIEAVKNIATELWGENGAAAVDWITANIGKGNVADYNVVNKLLNQGAGTQIQQAQQTRVSGLLYDIVMGQMAANSSLNKDAIRTLVKMDIADRSYRIQMYQNDMPAGIKAGVDVRKFSQDYMNANNMPESTKRYYASLDDKGRIDKSKGSALNPYVLTSESDYKDVPGGRWVIRHDNGQLVQKPYSTPTPAPYSPKVDLTHGLISGR